MTRGGRQLQLLRRENFFSDPVFADILAFDDDGFRKKLDVFKNRSTAILPANGAANEAAHNLQVTVSNDKFLVQLELPGFSPEDFSLRSRDDGVLVLEAVHEAGVGGADNATEFTTRKYIKEFRLPDGVRSDLLASTYSAEGILSIEAPRTINVPEGAAVQEAMAAKSTAYTTDDGRTSVKEASSAASSAMAATTESPDGRTKSSVSYMSSSSSASTSVTSTDRDRVGGGLGGPMGGGMAALGMDMDMDSMMKKMMGSMALDGPSMGGIGRGFGSGMSGFSSSSTSSTFSSMSSSTMTSSSVQDARSGGPGLRLGMGGLGMGGIGSLDIEELSTAGTDFSGPVNYTVTSPPPSTSGREMRYSVQAAPDLVRAACKTMRDPQADHTVLLKIREGDEYKLVLNMQQYQPENIAVRLNDAREITVTAHAGNAKDGGDDFVQRHVVPDGIDLDQMSSSFSADGILVIKAPRLKK